MSGLILDPTTLRSAVKREIAFQNPHIATFAAQADGIFRLLELTVVCLACGGTPQMRNAPGDAQWRMECACTTRVLTPPRAKREKLLS